MGCFHSIGCPSEWGRLATQPEWKVKPVSIQLVAPASGAELLIQGAYSNGFLFPFNWLPQRVGPRRPIREEFSRPLFPFNWLPQRVGPPINDRGTHCYALFPFNWLPQRVGPSLNPFAAGRCSGFHSIGCPSEWGRFGAIKA